jgi:hypothetical protein
MIEWQTQVKIKKLVRWPIVSIAGIEKYFALDYWGEIHVQRATIVR